ncbi:MAG TPA: 2Fe-2S iron-sulfur cluster-binding protein [Bdellovibrionota bacterium]|nr:2Fe-2S iron-sulfur cluster-binding protein [Bdellovibrionota bacterium]
MPKVTFVLESGERIEAEAQAGDTLTQVAYRAGVRIQQSCGGSPSCGDCVIRVAPESHPEAFEAMEHAEMALLGNVYFITKERLACQTVVKNDSTVLVPNAKSKAHKDSLPKGTRK